MLGSLHIGWFGDLVQLLDDHQLHRDQRTGYQLGYREGPVGDGLDNHRTRLAEIVGEGEPILEPCLLRIPVVQPGQVMGLGHWQS